MNSVNTDISSAYQDFLNNQNSLSQKERAFGVRQFISWHLGSPEYGDTSSTLTQDQLNKAQQLFDQATQNNVWGGPGHTSISCTGLQKNRHYCAEYQQTAQKLIDQAKTILSNKSNQP